jgi:hypothetical protein
VPRKRRRTASDGAPVSGGQPRLPRSRPCSSGVGCTCYPPPISPLPSPTPHPCDTLEVHVRGVLVHVLVCTRQVIPFPRHCCTVGSTCLGSPVTLRLHVACVRDVMNETTVPMTIPVARTSSRLAAQTVSGGWWVWCECFSDFATCWPVPGTSGGASSVAPRR